MLGFEHYWRRRRDARAVGYVLPYYPLSLVRRILSAWLDFLPAALIIFTYFWDGIGVTSEGDFLRDLSLSFLLWTFPRVLCGVVLRRSVGQLLLGGQIRSCVDGSRVTAARAGLRNALGTFDYVPGVTLVNVGMIFFRRDRRTLYDLVAGTVLVDVERAAPEDWASQVESGGFGS